jgi:UDP-N-acetylmuramoyl-L-alanyl-D-glutamate--2,6-diaminopimelate ligase
VPTNGRGFDVIVDYAHTPDGLENVLKSAQSLNPKRLIVVFGCGGDRDRTKRPIMGKIAAELADRVIVTSDNPRTENPESIIDEILNGVDANLRTQKVTAQSDRYAAIETAIRDDAMPGDIVVIAGKGHETYQLVGDNVLDFDDRKVAAEVLSK